MSKINGNNFMVTASMRVKKGKEDILLSEIKKHTNNVVVKEKDTLVYLLLQNIESSQEFVVMEMYSNEAGFKTHANHPDFPKMSKKISAALEAGKPLQMGYALRNLPAKLKLEGPNLHAVVAKIRVKDGCHAKFEKAISDLQKKVFEVEKGTLLYEAGLDKKDPNLYVVFEVYETRNALRSHMKQPHVHQGMKILNEVMSEPASIEQYSVLNYKPKSNL